MNDIIDYLKQLGLSDIESKLYTVLLKSGAVRVRELAKKMGMKRTTLYIYIDQLVEKGLVTKIVKGSHKLVAANNPDESLEYLINKKTEETEKIKNNFSSILKTIHTRIPEFEDVGDAEIKYFKTKNSVMKIYEDAFKSSEIRIYATLSELITLFPKNLNIFEEALINNPNLKIYELISDSPEDIKHIDLGSETGRYFHKFVHPHIGLTSAGILIYDDKVAILNVQEKMSGVVLQNRDYYTNSKKLFDFIWSTLPEMDR